MMEFLDTPYGSPLRTEIVEYKEIQVGEWLERFQYRAECALNIRWLRFFDD